MRVVVTGGQGALGSRVVEQLRARGHHATSASRRTGVDLSTGAGLDAALVGADAVVHTADTTSPRAFGSVTVAGTRRLAQAVAAMSRPAHLVAISIVGIEETPYAYYRAKLAAEEAIAAAGARATVQRATQFHSLVAAMARWGTFGPVAVGLRGMAVQPVSVDFVAEVLAETAVTEPPDRMVRAVDLAGPDRLGLEEVARLVAAHRGRSLRAVVRLPPLGATLRAFAAGAILAGPSVQVGGERFVDWLDRQPRRMRGR